MKTIAIVFAVLAVTWFGFGALSAISKLQEPATEFLCQEHGIARSSSFCGS